MLQLGGYYVPQKTQLSSVLLIRENQNCYFLDCFMPPPTHSKKTYENIKVILYFLKGPITPSQNLANM